MARHPILTEQFSKTLQRLLRRSSGRVSPARRRRASGKSAHSRPAVKLKTVKPESAKPPPIKTSVAPEVSSSHASKGKRSRTTAQRKGVAQVGTFWLDLFLVRPWLLVGGLWLSFVLMIAIALAGLSSPGRELTLEPVSSSIAGQPLSGPDAAAAARLPGDAATLAQSDPAATLPGAPERSMPTWPLLVMVAVCAGGCMLMSRPGLLTAESRRGRRRMPAVSVGPRPPARAAARPARSRRARRRLNAQQPASQVMAFRTGQKIRHSPTQRPTNVSKPVSFAMDTARSTAAVSVVPEGEASPLDWKEGSLAHKLDVRQTRSINSFL